MPTPAYMVIEGTKQGLITQKTFTEDSVGKIYQQGHEDEILVQAFEHQIIRPTDPQSGQPTGDRVHKPLMITKVFDRSSPLLFTALTTGESLTCTLNWYRPADGGLEHYFTMKLTDAVIVDISSRMPNCQDPDMASFTHLENVYFSYRHISWEHVVSNTSAADDWRKPVSK